MPIPASAITFIGGGNMARSLIGALLRAGASARSIAVAEPNAELRERLEQDFSVSTFTAGGDAAREAYCIVLAVKPQVMPEVCEQLSRSLGARRPLLVTIAAGIRIGQIETWVGHDFPIVRCMPNTPALIGAGATALIANPRVDARLRALAESILGSAGITAWIEQEELMDTVTGLSGSGPAYFFLLIEALEDAAVAQGLPRDTARALVIQTALGSARMAAEDDETPTRLRERVTSPGGTTQAALDSFAADGFREVVARAVAAATARGRELSERLGRSETP